MIKYLKVPLHMKHFIKTITYQAHIHRCKCLVYGVLLWSLVAIGKVAVCGLNTTGKTQISILLSPETSYFHMSWASGLSQKFNESNF